MRSFCIIATAICCYLITTANSADILAPTSSNSTDEYYTASASGDTSFFQFGAITCGTSTCDVQCDEPISCYKLEIDASKSDELNIHCSQYRSCEALELVAAPKTTLNMYCDAPQSCKTAAISADITPNIYISCNNESTTTAGDGACYSLQVNATYTTSLTFDCNGPYSCQSTYLYANHGGSARINIHGSQAFRNSRIYARHMTQTLDVNCTGYQSCYTMYLYANQMSNDLLLTCDGGNACQSSQVYATDMESSATLNCLSSNDCNALYMYCPETQPCNVHCPKANSCNNIQITVPDNQYEDINLNCNPITAESTSCYSANIICSSTNGNTALSYDSVNGYYKCNSYACCPIYEGTIHCQPGTDCQVNCTSPNNCRKHYINATEATSLHLDCTGSGCSGAKILCPTGVHTTCNITSGTTGGALQYSVIETTADSTMDLFALSCVSSDACQYAAVLLRSTSIADVVFRCDGSNGNDACRYVTFDIGSDNPNQAITNTFAVYGGAYMVMEIQSNLINALLWDCEATQSCVSATMELTRPGAVVNTFDLLCSGSSSCGSLTLHTRPVLIHDMTVECISCASASINATVRDNANMKCLAVGACSSVNVALIAMDSDVHFDIRCKNPSITTSYTNAACYNAIFTISGTGTSKSNLTTQCHQYDCRGTDFITSDLMNVDAGCDTPNSCEHATFTVTSADQFDLSCSDSESCQHADVYCPYRTEGACKIACSNDYHTCYSMNIYVPNAYTYDYLDISCPSEEITPNSDGCVSLTVGCTGGGLSTATFTYMNDPINDYQCQYSGSSYCCPYYQGTKIECADGEDCVVDCTNTDCSATFIAGADADSLTVECGYQQCQETLIHCPVSGCDIQCDAYYSCQSARIIYNGELSDDGTVSVNCTDTYACDSMTINAQYAADVYLGCDSTTTSNYACPALTLNAQYANIVNFDLRASSQYAMYNSRLYTDHANTVSLKAIGHYTFQSSYIYAEDAGTLDVVCSADSGNVACLSSYFYLSGDTTINCYGEGCHGYSTNYWYLGPHLGDALQFNVYSCGQCNSMEDCIYRIYLYCDAYSPSYALYFYGSDYSSNSGWQSTSCGIPDIENNQVFSFSRTDDNCYTPLNAISCDSGEDCVITCDAYNHNCMNAYIDGTEADYLTVECQYSDYCQELYIECPMGGCTISCSAGSVCSQAQIIYTGTKTSQELGINGDVSVLCTEGYACQNMQIDANYADSVYIKCIGSDSDNYPCYYMELQANYANHVTLDLRSTYATQSTKFYVRNASDVVLSAYSYYAFYSSYLYAEWADSVEINCQSDSGYYGCYSSEYYIPHNTTFNCYGWGCYNMGNVYATTDASGMQLNTYGCDQCTSVSGCMNYFYLRCRRYSSGSYSYSESCYGYTSYSSTCMCSTLISGATYTAISDDGACYAGTGAANDECEDGWDCTIHCDYSGKCNSVVIDGSNFASLAVYCNGYGYCESTRILCPNSGCFVDCSDDSACQYMQIHYSGTQFDYGTVHVQCQNSGSCYLAKIYAENANAVVLECTAQENYWNNICDGLELYATDAWSVTLKGNHAYGLYNSHLHVNRSKKVIVNARGQYGFYNSYLYATDATSVSIKCVGDDSSTGACTNNYYYLPSLNTTFDCYGYGCYGLGTIYTKDTAKNISFNVNACEECDGIDGCVGSIYFYCGYYGYSTSETYSYSCYNNYGYTGACGCDAMIRRSSYSNNPNDNSCYETRLSGQQIGSIIGAVIGGIVGCIVLVLLYRCCKRSCCGPSKAYSYNNNQNNSNIGNKKVYSKPVTVQPVRTVSQPVAQPVAQPVRTVVVQQPAVAQRYNQPGYVTMGSASVGAAVYVNNASSLRSTNDIQMTPMNASAPSAPSAPGMGDPQMPGASAPGLEESLDAPPAYTPASAPPAYGDILAQRGGGGAGEGEGAVTVM